ncbi:MAG: type IV pilus twitching motility protein PilT [Minisyncoccia bacterium]
MEKTISTLIDTMISEGASDIHFSVSMKPLIRVNGELITVTNGPELDAKSIDSMISILGGERVYKKFTENFEADFAYTHKNSWRLRGNAFMQKGMPSFTLRLIPEVKTLKDLQLPPSIENFAMARQGFFLVVGPVGQGKSTTLASMVEIINIKRAAHILTVEDPIEYIYTQKKSLIHQREAGIDTLDFPTALNAAFREDVNVILIGEMRDKQTIATAVTAAETGHLVLATLHTNNAAQTIDRIIDSFPAEQQDQVRLQLSASLLGIFSQRLIPRIAGGRVPAYELLINTPAVANLIREKRTHEIGVVIETSFESGMVDMNRSLLELVRAGEITMESALQYSPNPRGLQ